MLSNKTGVGNEGGGEFCLPRWTLLGDWLGISLFWEVVSDHLCITCVFLLVFFSLSFKLLTASQAMSFLAFALPIFSPIPLGAGWGLSKWLCGCLAAGWGQPTTDSPTKRCSLLGTVTPLHCYLCIAVFLSQEATD